MLVALRDVPHYERHLLFCSNLNSRRRNRWHRRRRSTHVATGVTGGLNPKAVNEAGPYYGLYQFDVGTWQSNGGTGLPSDASVAEQTRVAYNLYQARGAAPWPVCGKYL